VTSPQPARPPSDATVPAPRADPDPGRTVTAGQVADAILQVRERPGRCASEQVQAVLRALDLTVVPG
jgi:hypothetical protein